MTFTRLFSGVHEDVRRCPTPRGDRHVTVHTLSGSSRAPIVIASPDGEERSFAFRPLLTSARALAAAGHPVLRFDYLGQGQSESDYESSTLESRVDDLKECWEFFRDLTGKPPVVLGVRLGATVASIALARLPDLSQLIFWAPVLDSNTYLQQLLRVNIAMQMVAHGAVQRDRAQLVQDAHDGQLVSVNGFNLTGTFIDELAKANALAALKGWHGRGLTVSSSPPPALLASHPSWRTAQVQYPQFWKELKTHQVSPPSVLPETINWLSEEGRAAAAV